MGRPRKNAAQTAANDENRIKSAEPVSGAAEAVEAGDILQRGERPALKPYVMRVRITFTDDILGTAPSDPDIYRRFIGSKSPDALTIEEEVETLGVDAVADRQCTVFNRTPAGVPCLLDYQIRGFFKAACAAMKEVPGSLSSKIKAYKKYVDKWVFTAPRFIPFVGEPAVTILQRPLRASTPMGERVSLTSSERICAGATVEFTVTCWVDALDLVREWLDYGAYSGIGQWHNSGMGRFSWEEIHDSKL